MSIPKEDLYQEKSLTPGEFAENNPINHARSYAAEETIKFGQAVMQGTAADQGLVFDSASGKFLGVAMYAPDADGVDDDQYLAEDSMAVGDQGVIAVRVEEAVTAGGTVRIRHASATGKVPGDFATTAEANKTVVLNGAVWRETTTTSGVAKLYLDPTFSVTADT